MIKVIVVTNIVDRSTASESATIRVRGGSAVGHLNSNPTRRRAAGGNRDGWFSSELRLLHNLGESLTRTRELSVARAEGAELACEFSHGAVVNSSVKYFPYYSESRT